MKKIFIISLMLLASFAQAKPIALNFSRVDLTTFLDATYSEVLKKNFVLSPELLGQGRKVSLRVSIDDGELPKFLAGFLDQLGVQQSDQAGILYLSPKVAAVPTQQALAPTPLNLNSSLNVVQENGVLQGSMPSLNEKKSASVYSPVARTPEFLCALLNAVIQPSSCHPAGATLVLNLSDANVEKMNDLLKQIDRKLPRVKISATFIELATSSKDGFGLSITSDVLGKSLGLTFGTVGPGAITFKGANFSSVLDALKTDGRFKQVASPVGIINSGERYTIVIGDDVPTLGSVTTPANGTPVQSVQYRSSGVILDVVPRVIEPDTGAKIEATIKGQVSSFSSTATGVNNSPTLSKREVNTTLSMDDGEIVILGGLNGSKTSSGRSKLFGVIPWSYSDQADSTELMLMLTLQVVK